MDGNILDGFIKAIEFAFVILVPLAALGVWKLIEIIIWTFNHVSVSLTVN